MLNIIFSTASGGKHAPSQYRAILRELKNTKSERTSKLLAKARAIKDPYYISLSLFHISFTPTLKPSEAMSIIEEALKTSNKIERNWRKAELLTIFAKKLSKWRKSEVEENRQKIINTILDEINKMPEGKGLSDAILGCAPHLGCNNLLSLLNKAILNKGFELDDAKGIIRHWSKHCIRSGPTITELRDSIMKIEEDIIRSRLLGYLNIQCSRSCPEISSGDLFKAAVIEATKTKKEDHLETLGYLARWASTEEELDLVANAITKLEDLTNKARLFSTLGGRAHKTGFENKAKIWFKAGLAHCSEILESHTRASIKLNLAQGFARIGETDLASETFFSALEDCNKNEILKTRILKSMENLRFEIPVKYNALYLKTDKVTELEATSQTEIRNDILALYDTYEGGLKPIHYRAVARAAPLCYAYGLDLALMGFPIKNLPKFIDQVFKETEIGKSGKYLNKMMTAERILMVSCTTQKPPKDWEDLGTPVVTTSKPKNSKKIIMKEALKLARSQHKLNRVCLIMGLGKRGLPKSILNLSPYHLELTGDNVPLETCTAMGVIAEQYHSIKIRT